MIQRRSRLRTLTALRPGRPPKRYARINPRRARSRRGHGKDPEYRAFIVTLPCCIRSIPGHVCSGRITFSHVGRTGKGTSKKCIDREGVPMCYRGHLYEWQIVQGVFKGWIKEKLREWADRQIENHQHAFCDHQAAVSTDDGSPPIF